MEALRRLRQCYCNELMREEYLSKGQGLEEADIYTLRTKGNVSSIPRVFCDVLFADDADVDQTDQRKDLGGAAITLSPRGADPALGTLQPGIAAQHLPLQRQGKSRCLETRASETELLPSRG